MEKTKQVCILCPRACGSPRTSNLPGFCGADEGFEDYRISSFMAHYGEETMISGDAGSGTVFFTGCALKCCFCQNFEISHGGRGQKMNPDQVLARLESLLKSGVHNLNLVTPSHYADRLPALFDRLRQGQVWASRPVPLIWNSSAYETVSSLSHVQDMVDVYLVDMKFLDPDLAFDLTGARDYPDLALLALEEMVRQQPRPVFDDRGLIQKGLVIRHLVLPGHSDDSIRILDRLAAFIPGDTPLSLMSQYRPRGRRACQKRPDLQSFLSREEYGRVLARARNLGFLRILSQ